MKLMGKGIQVTNQDTKKAPDTVAGQEEDQSDLGLLNTHIAVVTNSCYRRS